MVLVATTVNRSALIPLTRSTNTEVMAVAIIALVDDEIRTIVTTDMVMITTRWVGGTNRKVTLSYLMKCN